MEFTNLVTTNKTDFFRESSHFDYLTKTVIPNWRRNGGCVRFHVWCAGCSTGEEPYTLAMTLAEVSQSAPGFDFAIMATDISTKVLEQAKLGIYDESRIEPIAMALRKKYLLRGKDESRRSIRIIPALRRKISFHRLNFMDDDYQIRSTFQAIFFRNVMIYFDKPTQEAVINKMCKSLLPGGHLFIGHSESLAGLQIPVTSLGSAIFEKQAVRGRKESKS